VAKRTGAAAVPVAAVAAVAAELPRHRAVCPSNPRIRPSLAVLISEAYSDAGTRAPGTWPFVLTLAIDLSGRTVTTLAVAAERTSAVPAVAAAAVPMGMMRAAVAMMERAVAIVVEVAVEPVCIGWGRGARAWANS